MPFAFVLYFGAPYLPTRRKTALTAMELLKLKPGDQLVDLGCGDGSVMLAAARLGIKSVGYELNPVVFVVAWLRTRRYRKLVTVKFGNFWHQPLPETTTAVFTFLHTRFMSCLDTYLVKEAKRLDKKLQLVSYTFEVPGKKPVDSKPALYLYQY